MTVITSAYYVYGNNITDVDTPFLITGSDREHFNCVCLYIEVFLSSFRPLLTESHPPFSTFKSLNRRITSLNWRPSNLKPSLTGFAAWIKGTFRDKNVLGVGGWLEGLETPPSRRTFARRHRKLRDGKDIGREPHILLAKILQIAEGTKVVYFNNSLWNMNASFGVNLVKSWYFYGGNKFWHIPHKWWNLIKGKRDTKEYFEILSKIILWILIARLIDLL